MSDNVVESMTSFLERFANVEANAELQAAARRLATTSSSSVPAPVPVPVPQSVPAAVAVQGSWSPLPAVSDEFLRLYEAELQNAIALGMPYEDEDL